MLSLEPQPGKLGALFDRIAGPHDLFLGRPESPYLQLGVAGIACGFAVLLALALWTGASIAIAAVLAVAAIATFTVAGLIRTSAAGHARHVVLEDLVLVFAVTAALLWLLDEPVLSYLDLIAPALGAFLVCGRLGCLLCGCCHGRPARWGIRYPDDAVPAALVGIRLVPVQLVEAAWCAAMTLVAGLLVVGHAAPGAALSLWLLGYAAGRFVLDFVRGDAVRAYLGPLSRTQWIALALLGGRAIWDGAAAAEPITRLAAAGGAAILVIVGYATRRRWLDLPRPLITATDIPRWEAWAAALVNRAQTEQRVEQPMEQREVTSETLLPGLTVSLGIDPSDDGAWLHTYTMARRGAVIERGEALAVAGFLCQRLPAPEIVRAQTCEHGRFHLWMLVRSREPGAWTDDESRLVLYRAQAFAGAIARLAAAEHGSRPPPPISIPAAPPAIAAAPTIAPHLRNQLPLGYHLAEVSSDDKHG